MRRSRVVTRWDDTVGRTSAIGDCGILNGRELVNFFCHVEYTLAMLNGPCMKFFFYIAMEIHV